MSSDGNAPAVVTVEESERNADNAQNKAFSEGIVVPVGAHIATIAMTYDPSATIADRQAILTLLKSHAKVNQAVLMTRNAVPDSLPVDEVVMFDVRSRVRRKAAPVVEP